jgi:hypothetical protein
MAAAGFTYLSIGRGTNGHATSAPMTEESAATEAEAKARA